MKVLVSRLSSEGIGGAELSAQQHVSELNKLGHQAELLSNFTDTGTKTTVPANKILAQAKFFLIALRHALKRPDIFNPHSRYDQIAFTLTKWLHRRPVVWKDPGDLVHQIKQQRRGLARVNQNLLIAAIKRADAIYTLNEEDRKTLLGQLKQLSQEVDAKKITVVPSDISFDDFDLKTAPVERTGQIVVGTVSQLHQSKGVQHLIAAVRTINNPDIELWIVGDGPYRSELEDLAQGLSNVTFWGYRSDTSALYKGMDIFVQPAILEGWGRTVKEAMYFSKAIIGSNVGGIAQQIEHKQTGLLFEPGDNDGLVKQLELLISDQELRQKLGARAHTAAVAAGDYHDLVKDQILPIFSQFVRPGAND